MEQTYIMIKPDGVQRGLVGEIIGRFEKRGYKLVALKLVQPSVEHLEKHYEDLSSKGFFKGLIKYMASGQSSRARARGGHGSTYCRRSSSCFRAPSLDPALTLLASLDRPRCRHGAVSFPAT